MSNSERFNEHFVRPGVLWYSPKAQKERQDVKQRQKEAAEHYKQAQEKIRQGEFEEAEHLLEYAIASWPDNLKFLLAIAGCIGVHRADPQRALPRYHHVVAQADTPAHRIARGRCFAACGKLKDAYDDYNAAVMQEPQNGHFIKLRGIILQRAGRFAEARADFTDALALLKAEGQPVFDCYFNRGFCNRMLRSLDEAVADFEAAMALKSDNTNAKTLLGAIRLEDRHEYRAAHDLFALAASFDRQSPAAVSNLALMQYLIAIAPDEAMRKKAVAADAAPAAAAAAAAAVPTRAAPSGTGAATRQMRRSTGARSATHGAGAGATKAVQAGPQDCDISDSEDDDERGGSGARGGGEDPDAPRTSSSKPTGPARKNNEHPKQWAMTAIAGSVSEASAVHDPARLLQLQTALRGFNTALALYKDPATRLGAGAKAEAVADPPRFAVYVGEAADIPDGILLMLSTHTRIPGSPIIHEREIIEGELEYNRGLVNLALGRLADAEADLKSALVLNSTHAHYPHYQAVVAARKGDYAAAQEWNNRSLALNPVYVQALSHQGLVLHLLSNNAEALQLLDSALALTPKAWNIMEARGRVLQDLDRHVEALPSLREALRLLDADQPPSVSARLYHAVAQSAIVTHDKELLHHALKQARLHGQDPASVDNLQGLLAMQERRTDRALKYMTRAIKHSPKEARFLFDRSQCHMQQQHYDDAVRDITQALELLPGSPTLLYHRGMAYAQMLDDPGALAALEAAAAAVEAEPGGRLQPDARLLEGSRMLNNNASAADLTPMLWYHLGCVRARLFDFPSAAEALQLALRLLPGHPALLHEHAKACQGCGRHAEAVQQFTKVLQQQPWNVRAMIRRGVSLKHLKRYDEAAADLEAARRLEPTHPALQVDYKVLNTIDVLELCRPGEEVQVLGY